MVEREHHWLGKNSLLQTQYAVRRLAASLPFTVTIYRVMCKAEKEAMQEVGGFVVSRSASPAGEPMTRVFLHRDMREMLRLCQWNPDDYQYLVQARVWISGWKRGLLRPDISQRRREFGYQVHVPTINQYLAEGLCFVHLIMHWQHKEGQHCHRRPPFFGGKNGAQGYL